MEKFEIKSENIKNKNPEHSLENRENNEIPEQRYIDVCKNLGKSPEIVKQMSKTFDINLRNGLENKKISYKSILEKNGLSIENLA